MKKLDKILSIIVIILLITIFAGTVFALLKNKKSFQKQKQLISQGKAVSLMAPKNDNQFSYFNLGSLRVLTKPENDSLQETQNMGTVLLVTPWISYPSDDTIFFEEISRKKTVIAGIIQDYFSDYSKLELLTQTEVKIEENLIKEINNHLSLGKIQQIYFTDYIFLD
ncbi:MAG: hypothetical protein SPH83_02085 [Treponema sp.]|nr:hypothetical protein [Spirochaetales bacterium]MDY6189270.1 hypothetical protein [Treponema sp.]